MDGLLVAAAAPLIVTGLSGNFKVTIVDREEVAGLSR
jgi:hypothetical protein